MFPYVTMSQYSTISSLLSQSFPQSGAVPLALPATMVPPAASAGAAAIAAQSTSDIFAQNQAQALVGLADVARQLQSGASALDPSQFDSAFAQMSVTSSAPGSVAGTAFPDAPAATYQIDVTQVAAAQVNQGAWLSGAAPSALGAGTQTFAITAGGTTTNVSFTLTGTESQLGALQQMANAVNASNAGVTASIQNDGAGNNRLVFTDNQTGSANTFTVSDVSGGAVAWSGVAATTLSAQDALYNVNGNSYTSASNNVSVGGMTNLTLLSPVSGATVTVGQDPERMAAAASQLVANYNDMVQYLQENQQYLTPTLATSLQQAYQDSADSLQQIGITQNQDGTLAIDNKALNQALQSDFQSTANTLGGAMGFAGALNDLAGQITSSPLSNYAAQAPNTTAPALTPVTDPTAATYGAYTLQYQLVGQLLNATV